MANQLGPFPVEFGTVFPSVLSGLGDCCALLHLGLLWLVRHAVSRDAVHDGGLPVA